MRQKRRVRVSLMQQISAAPSSFSIDGEDYWEALKKIFRKYLFLQNINITVGNFGR